MESVASWETHSRSSFSVSHLSRRSVDAGMYVCVQRSPDTFLFLIVFACIMHRAGGMLVPIYSTAVSFACVLVCSSLAPVGFQCSVKQHNPFSRLVVLLSLE